MAIRWRAWVPLTVVALTADGCSAEAQTQPPPPPPPPPVCSISTAPLPASDVTVTVDVSRRFQTIDGFGTSQRLFDDPHVTNTSNPTTGRGGVVIPADQQAAIMRALYSDIGLTRARYSTDPNIEPVNDNADPNVTDLSKFNFAWKGGDGHIAQVNADRAYGLTKWWGSPLTPGETWMGGNDVAEYVEWALAIIRHWNAAGTPLTWWSLFNEPAAFSGLGTRSGEFMRDAIKKIGPVLVAEGIPTRILIPDDVTPAEALSRASIILADPAARQYVVAIGTHPYGGAPNNNSMAELSALAKQYGLPLWLTEWSTSDWWTWANAMHTWLHDFDIGAIDYQWGFFGEWEGPGPRLISIQSSGTQYIGFVREKQYYVMGHYSAYVRPGTPRVAADASGASSASLRATAYFDGTKVVVVVLNVGHSDVATRIELGAGIPCVRSLAAVRTSGIESGAQQLLVTLDAPHFVTTFPAQSITTLVAQ